MKHASALLAVGLGLGLGLHASHAQPAMLTLYSAQHQQVDAVLTAEFTKETGIKVLVHEGEGPDVASQILQEGADSPADVFFTENSPELNLLDEKGLLARWLPPRCERSRQIQRRRRRLGRRPGAGKRAGLQPRQDQPGALPASLLDLAQPEWAGKMGIAPSDADFLPLVSAVINQEGKAAALAWLKGLKANGLIYQDDESVVAAVARGDVATGIINNYYWYRLETELGPEKIDSKIYHFKSGDIGGLINVSGAAVLKSSQNQAAAQKFLAFLASQKAQEMLGQARWTMNTRWGPASRPMPS